MYVATINNEIMVAKYTLYFLAQKGKYTGISEIVLMCIQYREEQRERQRNICRPEE